MQLLKLSLVVVVFSSVLPGLVFAQPATPAPQKGEGLKDATDDRSKKPAVPPGRFTPPIEQQPLGNPASQHGMNYDKEGLRREASAQPVREMRKAGMEKEEGEKVGTGTGMETGTDKAAVSGEKRAETRDARRRNRDGAVKPRAGILK